MKCFGKIGLTKGGGSVALFVIFEVSSLKCKVIGDVTAVNDNLM